MLKKNKDKIGNIENSPELSPNSQKHVKLGLDVPELFSTPDVIIDANKTPKTEYIGINIENIDKTISEKSISDTSSMAEKRIVNKEEPVRIRKISNKSKNNPAEITVTKTAEDLLDSISYKVKNETENIYEDNLIDELADLNEDYSVCKLIKCIELIEIN